MSLQGTIDHAVRRVTATLHEATTDRELYEFLGEVIGQNAMPYGKLVDARVAPTWIAFGGTGPLAVTARLYSRMRLGPIGPLAIVVAGERGHRGAEHYERLSDAARPVRIFHDLGEAEAWLASQPPS